MRYKDRVLSDMVLMEVYDEAFKIADHNDRSKPLSLVAHHSTEDRSESDRLYRTLMEFASYELSKVFGTSLNEYLEFPTYVQQCMINVAVKRAERLSETVSELERELDL